MTNSASENLIMLIDDDESSHFLNKILIEEVVGEGIEKVSFQMAPKAISYLDKLAEEKRFLQILIFLDINMPVMNGFEFLDRIKERYSNAHFRLIIVMLTSSIHPRDHERSKNYAVFQYLVKPLDQIVLRPIMIENRIPVLDE